MRGRILMGLAIIAGLSACTQQSSGNQAVAHSVQIGNKPYRCLLAGDMNIAQPMSEVKGALRDSLLTQDALNAGVRVMISATDINQYGSLVINYVDRENTCTLWTEGLTLQEYAQKLGLNPVGISPFYEVQKPEPPKAPVTPVEPPKTD